jgi:hypothetical protein
MNPGANRSRLARLFPARPRRADRSVATLPFSLVENESFEFLPYSLKQCRLGSGTSPSGQNPEVVYDAFNVALAEALDPTRLTCDARPERTPGASRHAELVRDAYRCALGKRPLYPKLSPLSGTFEGHTGMTGSWAWRLSDWARGAFNRWVACGISPCRSKDPMTGRK